MRPVFECPRCRGSHSPIDEELGARPHERISRGVAELVSWKAARQSFDDASEDLRHCHGLGVSSSEVARIVHEVGARAHEYLAARDERWSEPVSSDRPVFAAEIEAGRLVVEIDGTIVLTRPGEEHKTVWVARAFDAATRGAGASGRAHITESRYATGAGTLEEFKYSVDALANRMGARSAEATAVVADGAPPLWNLLGERLPHAVQIQDYWHVSEHLHALAKDLFGEQSPKAHERGEAWSQLLFDGATGGLIEQLEAERKRRRGAKRQRISRELAYLHAGRHRMDYPRYRAQGWPIGSGAAEGACKHLVKERFGLTGARWRRSDIKDVLALRTAQFNNEWNDLWNIRDQRAA